MTALATTTSTFPSKSIQCSARGQTEGPIMSKLSTSFNFELFQLSPFSNSLNHSTSSKNNEETQQQRVTLPSARSLISTVDRILLDKPESDSYNDNYNNLLSNSYMNYRRDRSSITKPIPKLKERPGPYPQKFSFSYDGNGNPLLLRCLPQKLPDVEGRGGLASISSRGPSRLSFVQRADRPSQRKQSSLSGLLTLKDLHLHDRSPGTSISTFSRPSSGTSSVTDIDMFDFHDIKDVLERQYDGEPFHLEKKKNEF